MAAKRSAGTRARKRTPREDASALATEKLLRREDRRERRIRQLARSLKRLVLRRDAELVALAETLLQRSAPHGDARPRAVGE
jgi:hypothetical protein